MSANAIPTRISAPRKIGLAIVDKVKAEIEYMQKKDLIEKITADRPAEWCHPFCPRLKADGGIRPTVDMHGLNQWNKRPTYPLTTPHEVLHPGCQEWLPSNSN